MQLAQSYLQGMASPFDGVLEAYGQGQGFRENRGILEAREAEQARKIQAQQELELLDWNDMGAVRRVVAQFPEYTAGAKEYYGQMEVKAKEGLFRTMSRGVSALQSGSNQVASDLFKSQAEGYRNAGDEDAAEAAEWLSKMSITSPETAQRALMLQLASVGGKDTASNYKSLVDADIAENESPYTIKEKIANADGTQATTFKTRADAIDTVSDGLSTAAIGGNAGTFSLKAGMMHAQGLISDAQKEYIDEQLRNENPEAVAEFLNGLAGQNIEIAKLNKPEVSVVNAGGQLVAIKKNADGSVELVGSVDKTVSPDVKYAQDATNARTEYTIDAQVGIANQKDATAREQQALTQYLADQKAEIASGKFTQKTMPDGRVLLFNDKGEWKPVLDTNGKPMVSKKSVADKPLNESQANSLMYGKRMQTSNKILEDLESSGVTRGWSLVGVKNEDQRKYEQAQRNFINAILRKESGAVIGQDEFDSAKKQYFPAFWDNEEVIKQKAANRRQVTNSMLTNAGPKGEAASKKSSTTVKTNDLF